MSLKKNDKQIKKWLVRSNGELLGPYSYNEIAEHLQNGNLIDDDEICQPFGRYCQISLEPHFSKLREEMMDSTIERTNLSLNDKTRTVSINNTITDTDVLDVGNFDKTDPEFVLPEELIKGESKKAEKRFGSNIEREVEKKISSYRKYLWVTVVAFILISGVFFLIKNSVFKSKINNFENLANKGWDSYQVGDYEGAWSFLSQADVLIPNQSEILVKLSPLRMILKGERVAARRELESLLASKRGRQVAVEVYTALGLLYMESNDWEQAENQLLKALSINGNFTSALLNKMMLNFHQKQWRNLKTSSKEVMEVGESSLLSYFISGWGYLKEYKKNLQGKERGKILLRANQALKIVTDQLNPYRAPAFLLKAYSAILGNTKKEGRFLRGFLDALGDSPQNYYRDILVYKSDIDWIDLFDECKFVSENLLRKSRQRALYSLCLVLSQREHEATKFIDEAVFMAPKDGFVQTIRAFYLRRTGQDGEAISSGRVAQKSKKYALPFLIEGSICAERNKLKCAKSRWQEALKINSRLLPAYMGLLKTSKRKKYWIEKIEKLYPNYLPLYRYRGGKSL